ncbi:MAG TPA: hypothetical protein VI457_01015 [Methylococcaceae bacterium]|nr:hypothetical protein [Methylococcaceae bacterium]
MPTAIHAELIPQATPEVLAALRRIADNEGRQLQSVLDEALREYIERKEQGRPRRQVLDAFAHSVAEFDSLYRELAK